MKKNKASRNKSDPPSIVISWKKGMKKKMGCKARSEAKYRSNLMVVRILAN